MNEKKIEIYLSEIKKLYPDKRKLNKTQYCRVKGISISQFTMIINNKNYEKLPTYKFEEKKKRNGTIYRTYEFDIYDIAVFLAS